MLQKSRSKQIHVLKYALLIPVVLSMLAFTSSVENVYSQEKGKWETEITYHQISLLERIQAVKEQIQAQGNVSDHEDYGLQLLLKVVQGNELDQDLITKVQAYTSKKNKTPLEQKISAIFHQIQAQGNISNEEHTALKKLLVFTSDGFDKPYFDDVAQDVEVPYGVIEQVPTYPGCEDLATNEERKKCTSENIQKFVAKNFNTNIGKEYGLTGRQRINVMFKIDRSGAITDARARAGHPALEQEALRVINALPKMNPGKQKGKTVTVPYNLPIVFQVQDTQTPKSDKPTNLNDLKIVPFAVVDEPPIYPGCENIKDKKDQMACFSEKLQSFVSTKFDKSIAKKANLKGKQRVDMILAVDEYGKVSGMQFRATSPKLEEEADRVINSLPQMIPAKQNGKNTKVAYFLPIVFEVD